MSRSTTLGRCVMHNKLTYRTYETAAKVSRSMPIEGRVFHCEFLGGYHLTSASQADRDRQLADPARPLSIEAITTIQRLVTEYHQTGGARTGRRLAGSVPGLLRHIQYLNQTPNGDTE